MKYKVGDKVRVKANLSAEGWYDSSENGERNVAVDEMLELAGKIVEISQADDQYTIKDYGFNWVDTMFEPIEEDFDTNAINNDEIVSAFNTILT